MRMAAMSPEEIEGRLHGQRAVLAAVLAELIDRGGDEFARKVDALLLAPDHQEDPGAVPDPAFAIEAAAAQEVRLVLERAGAMRAKT